MGFYSRNEAARSHDYLQANNSIFCPGRALRCSLGFVLIVLLLLSFCAHHFYGQKQCDEAGELSIYDIMTQDYQHPLKNFVTYVWSTQGVPLELKVNPWFNFFVGLSLKFLKLILLFFLLRMLIRNDMTVLITVMSLIFFGKFINESKIALLVNHATYYNFRDLAALLAIASLLFLFKRRWFLAGITCGIIFLVHAKIGIRWTILMGSTLFACQWAKEEDLRKRMKLYVKFFLPFVLICAAYSFFSYIHAFLDTNASSFPLYTFMLKFEPDDYLFITKFSVFSAYKKNIALLLLGALNLFLYHVWIKKHTQDTGKGILFHPLTLVTVIFYGFFVLSVVLEYFLTQLSGGFSFIVYALKLWSLYRLFVFVFAIIAGITFSLSLWALEKRGILRLSYGFVKKAMVALLMVFMVITFFMHENNKEATVYGKAMYKDLFASAPFDVLDFLGRDFQLIYLEDDPVVVFLPSEKLDTLMKETSHIHRLLMQGDRQQAQELFKRFESQAQDIDSKYFDVLRINTLATLESFKGKIWSAYNLYCQVSQYKNTPFLPIQELSLARAPVSKIPFKDFREAMLWIRKNMPQDAAFLNAPHIDYFSLCAHRDSFFMNAEHEGQIASANVAYAKIYQERLYDVVGLSFFDIPGITYSFLSVPRIRYAFLALTAQDFRRIHAKYPDYNYIFTEVSHELEFPLVYKNKYFAIYKLEG